MTMEYSGSDNPGGGSSGLRRSVGQATERIHEIIDAAERVAEEIRGDAEAEARRYLDERRREADRAAQDRQAALDQLTESLADTAEQFKRQAERLLGELDRMITDARAGVHTRDAVAAIDERPEERFTSDSPDLGGTPPLEPLGGRGLNFDSSASRLRVDDPFELPPLDPQPVEPFSGIPESAPEREPEPEPRERERPAAAVSAYPGRSDSWRDETPPADADMTSQALLRATQLAVTGKGRSEIADTLRADFPGVDAEPLLDEILD